MFMLSRNAQSARRALEHYRTALSAAPLITLGAIHTLTLGERHLHWCAAKPADNLHVFANGVVLGKLDFNEANQLMPIQHEGASVPTELHPLLLSTRIVQHGANLIITPNQVTHVYIAADHDAAADSQLVLAASIGVQPDLMRIAIMSSAGYLPGNLTLFAEIQKIPLVHAYATQTKTFTQTQTLTLQPNDDDAMIARLVEIAPHVPSVLGMTGGYDSRFILGCLLKAGVRPRLLHLQSDEQTVVIQLAEQLGLDLDVVEPLPSIEPDLHTLMNDGMIYMRGGNFNRMRAGLSRDQVCYNGLAISSAIKDMMRTAWKVPFMRGDIHQRLIRFGIIGKSTPASVTLRTPVTREAVEALLYQHLTHPQQLLVELRTSKQWGNWYYYLNRGVRWAYTALSDISFYTYSVFLGADLPTVMLGLTSPAWGNFRHERARALNHRLLPDLHVNYLDGLPVTTQPGIKRAYDMFAYEYLKRFQMRQRLRREYKDQAQTAGELLKHIPESGASFAQFYNAPLQQVITSDAMLSEKRAAITLHYVLDFLDQASA